MALRSTNQFKQPFLSSLSGNHRSAVCSGCIEELVDADAAVPGLLVDRNALGYVSSCISDLESNPKFMSDLGLVRFAARCLCCSFLAHAIFHINSAAIPKDQLWFSRIGVKGAA